MLVLVGVTVNVTLTGGLFEKAEKAAYLTNVATIQEKLAMKKAEVLAGNGGKSQDDYGITISGLELTGSLKEFETKLTISKDGTLYYIEDEVNDKEKAWLAELGITAKNKTESGTLVYGKIYRGTVTQTGSEGAESYTMEIAFSKKYNKVFIITSNALTTFEYNEDENTLTMAGMQINLSDSGEKISWNINNEEAGETIQGELNLTDDIPFATYAPEENAETDTLYDGWYYNGQLNSLISVSIYTSEDEVYVSIILDEDGRGRGGNGNVEDYINTVTNELGITVVDSTHLSKDGYVYTLLEKLEI